MRITPLCGSVLTVANLITFSVAASALAIACVNFASRESDDECANTGIIETVFWQWIQEDNTTLVSEPICFTSANRKTNGTINLLPVATEPYANEFVPDPNTLLTFQSLSSNQAILSENFVLYLFGAQISAFASFQNVGPYTSSSVMFTVTGASGYLKCAKQARFEPLTTDGQLKRKIVIF